VTRGTGCAPSAPGVRTVLVVTADPGIAAPIGCLNGWRVVLATPGEPRATAPSGDSGGVLSCEDEYGVRVYRLGRPGRGRLGWWRALKRVIALESPALIDLHAPGCALAESVPAVAGDIPLIVTWHGRPQGQDHPPLSVRAEYRRRRMLQRAAWIICFSQSQRDHRLTAVRAKCSVVAAAPPTDGRGPGEPAADRTASVYEAVIEGRPPDGRRRLAVVAPYFPPRVGGVEQYAYRIARGAGEQDGYEVVVLTSGAARRTLVEVVDGITVFRLPRWAKVSNTPVNPLWPWRLRAIMAANRIDLVNAHAPVPFMAESAALACGSRPLVVTYHCSLPKGRPVVDALIRPYERWVLPLLLRRADAVVSVSQPVARWLEPYARGKGFVVSPGVDDATFVPRAPDVRTSTGQRVPTVLYVGRMERASAAKGVEFLLEAFALVARAVPQARLVMVGGGDALEEHRRLAVSLGILARVEFRGIVTLPDLVAAYQEASVVVLPSTTASESFGMVLIEAMACGKPVIGSDVGGIPFVIDDGHDGLLVPPGSADELARACLRILEDPVLAARLGEAGRRKVEEGYGWGLKVDCYRRIFERVLDGAVGASPVPGGA